MYTGVIRFGNGNPNDHRLMDVVRSFCKLIHVSSVTNPSSSIDVNAIAPLQLAGTLIQNGRARDSLAMKVEKARRALNIRNILTAASVDLASINF